MRKAYSERSSVTLNLPHLLQARIEKCVSDVLKGGAATSKTFHYSDYGSAYGRSAAIMARTVLSEMRSAGGPDELSVVLEDQETNDFRSAFKHFAEAFRGSDVAVHVQTVGRSFFRQCVPSASVHFATSNFAAMYFDKASPLEGFQTGYSFGLLRRLREVGGDRTALAERDRAHLEALDKKGAADWERFLLCRAKELRRGGRLLVSARARFPLDCPEFERFKGQLDRGMEDAMQVLVDAVHALTDSGDLSRATDLEENFVVPTHRRTLEEVKAPFVAADSPVRKAGLQLLSAEYFAVPHPKAIESVASLSEDDVRRLAETYSQEVWTYTSPMVRNALKKTKGRREEEVSRLHDAIFEKMKERMVTTRRVNISQSVFVVDVEKTA